MIPKHDGVPIVTDMKEGIWAQVTGREDLHSDREGRRVSGRVFRRDNI